MSGGGQSKPAGSTGSRGPAPRFPRASTGGPSRPSCSHRWPLASLVLPQVVPRVPTGEGCPGATPGTRNGALALSSCASLPRVSSRRATLRYIGRAHQPAGAASSRPPSAAGRWGPAHKQGRTAERGAPHTQPSRPLPPGGGRPAANRHTKAGREPPANQARGNGDRGPWQRGPLACLPTNPGE